MVQRNTNKPTSALLIDIGNTSLKWVLSSDVSPQTITRLTHDEAPDALAAQWADLQRPQRLLIANVGQRNTADWVKKWAQEQWRLDAEFLDTEAQGFDVVNGYADPGQLGIDRWLALIAARRLSAKSLCVVDAGSAITIDLLPRDGYHLGGYIAPGLQMMQHSIAAGTALPPFDAAAKAPLVGRDTGSAIAGGALMSAAGFIERTLIEWQTRLRAEPELILTGGDAERLAQVLCCPARVEPTLVFQGMQLQARKAKPKPEKKAEK